MFFRSVLSWVQIDYILWKEFSPVSFQSNTAANINLSTVIGLEIFDSQWPRLGSFNKSFSGLVLKPFHVVDRNNLTEKGKMLLFHCCPNFIFNESSQDLHLGYLVAVMNKRWPWTSILWTVHHPVHCLNYNGCKMMATLRFSLTFSEFNSSAEREPESFWLRLGINAFYLII